MRHAQSRPQPPRPICSNRIGVTVSARIRQVVKPITEIGAAVVGTGFIGVVHVEALRRLGVQVLGVVGSSRERAASRARDSGLPPAYESFQAMLDDPRVDVVHITSPNHLHHEHATAALGAGKHVVCEKPLAMTSAQSAELLEVAERSGRVHAVNFNLRFYATNQHVHGMIANHELGEVRLVSGHYLQDWLLLDTDWNWRLEPQLGGELRAVADIGTHVLDTLMWLTQRKVTEVCADLATVIRVRRKPRGRVESFQKASAAEFDEVKITTDDCASVLLRFEGGLRGVITVSQISAGRKARLWWEIDGSEGSVSWDSEEPNTLWMGRRAEPNQVMPKDPALMSPATRGYSAYPGGHTEGYPDTFAQLFKDFYAYVEKADFGAARSFPTFQTGHDEMVLCDAILASSRERKWVGVKYSA